MNQKSRRMALCGMMCALGVTIMLLGGVIPLSTFCCPALAGVALIPILVETDRRTTLAAWIALSALSLILGADKEAALLLAFMGHYPVTKCSLDKIRRRPLRILAKLAVFNLCAGAMLLAMSLVFNMQAALAEYAAMTGAMLALFAVIANFTLLVYDRLLAILYAVYIRKIRPALRLGR